MRKREREWYVLMTLGFEIILTYIYMCTICNKYMCMYMYTFIYMYINLRKMYRYMLKHHLQFSHMMHDEMLISHSGPLAQKMQMGVTIKICCQMLVFLKWYFKINNCAHMYIYVYIMIKCFKRFWLCSMFLGWRYLLLP